MGDYALYKELIEDDKTYLYHRIRILDYNGGGEFTVQCVDIDMKPINIHQAAIYFMPKQLSEWAPLSLQVVMSKKQVGSKIKQDGRLVVKLRHKMKELNKYYGQLEHVVE